jgi:hypothetical protein
MAGLLSPAVEDAVTATLREWASKPFDLGNANCGLSVLAYAERAIGVAPLPAPRTVSAASWARLMRRPTAMTAYCRAIMAELGCAETCAPDRGDVGLIAIANGLTAALCLGNGMWAARGLRSVVMQPAGHAVAWRVTCRTR